MINFKLKLPASQNVVWLPKQIVETFGRSLTLTPTAKAALLYSDNTRLEEVLESLGIIEQELTLRIKQKAREASKK